MDNNQEVNNSIANNRRQLTLWIGALIVGGVLGLPGLLAHAVHGIKAVEDLAVCYSLMRPILYAMVIQADLVMRRLIRWFRKLRS